MIKTSMSNYKKIKNFFRKDGQFGWNCAKKVKNYPINSVSVYIMEIKNSLGIDCAWEVVSDDDLIEESANSTNPSIVLSHTHKFIQIYDSKTDKIVYEEVWPLYSKIPEEVQNKIAEAKTNSYAIKQGNAWDPKLISKKISDWVWHQTGRTVDFNFDPMIS